VVLSIGMVSSVLMDKSVDPLERRNGLYLVIQSFVTNVPVLNGGVLGCSLLIGECVHHPGVVLSLREVVSGMSTSRLFSVFRGVHNHLSIDKQVFKFKCLDQIGVPDLSSVANFNVIVHLRDVVHFLAAFFKPILSSKDGGVSLHSSL